MQTQTQRMPSAEQSIETPRLLLISVTEAMLLADKKGQGLGELLGAIVPSTWPPAFWDQKAIDYLYERVHRNPQSRGWCRYVTLKQEAASPLVIGGCGCTEPPDAQDEVEIGYSILPEFRRHGYVTEALNALVPGSSPIARCTRCAHRRIPTSRHPSACCANADSFLTEQVKIRGRCCSGTGASPQTDRPFPSSLHHSKVKSAKTKLPCCSTTPGASDIGFANIGPAYAQVWNSPFSAHGSVPGGSSASKDASSSRPAKDRGSLRGSTHVIRARNPPLSISCASA